MNKLIYILFSAIFVLAIGLVSAVGNMPTVSLGPSASGAGALAGATVLINQTGNFTTNIYNITQVNNYTNNYTYYNNSYITNNITYNITVYGANITNNFTYYLNGTYNSTYHQNGLNWEGNYSAYSKYWYNMSDGSYNSTYNTWLPNYTAYNKYWYNMTIDDQDWQVNHTGHVIYLWDSFDKICIGTSCVSNPFYKVTIDGGLNVTGNSVFDGVFSTNILDKWTTFQGNISAPNICYSNGTGCNSTYGSTYNATYHATNQSILDYINERYNVTKEPTGFPEQGTFSSSLNFDDSKRNFSINGTYDIYYKGRKISKSGYDSVVIPVTAGYVNYIYFDSNGVLQTSVNPWNNDFSNVIQVATVFWNGSVGLIGKERHGLTMDSATHYYLHTTVGTRYVSGFTGTFTNASNWTLTTGTIADEDNIDINPPNSNTRVFYHTTAGRYTFTPIQNNLYHTVAGVVQYDNLTGTSDVAANRYVAYWIVESVDRDEPTYTVMGQRTDITLADARANNNWESMVLSEFNMPEYKLLYRIILQRSGTATPTIADIQDLRSVSNLPSGTYTATSHGALTGLLNDDHTQYLLVDGTRNQTNLYVTQNVTANWFFGALNWSWIQNIPSLYINNWYNHTAAVEFLYGKWFYNQTQPAINIAQNYTKSHIDNHPSYNQTYESTTNSFNGNITLLLGALNNASYLSTYNITYQTTTNSFNGNITLLLGSLNNASYLSTYNATYHETDRSWNANFTANVGYWLNHTLAVYSVWGKWFYNQTDGAAFYTNNVISGNNSAWLSTYNITYDNAVTGLNANFSTFVTTYNSTYEQNRLSWDGNYSQYQKYWYNHTSAVESLYGKWFYNQSTGTQTQVNNFTALNNEFAANISVDKSINLGANSIGSNTTCILMGGSTSKLYIC